MPRYRYQVYPDADALAEAAARDFVAAARSAIREHGVFFVALAGGSTPRALYTLLAAPPYREQVDWLRVQVFFGDERCVGPEDAQSNFRMAREALLAHVPVPAEQIHRMQGDAADVREAARRYAAELAILPSTAEGWPRFDFVLLGMGEDGHTASLFPGTAILEERSVPVAAVHVDKLAAWRISLTLPVLDAAARVRVLVAGAGKRGVVSEIMGADGPLEKYPVSWLKPRPTLIWYMDVAVAADLAPAAEK